MKRIITNEQWKAIYDKFIAAAATDDGYTETINFSFSFNPATDNKMSDFKGIFNPKKAAKMFFWYNKADIKDASIIEYFSEYKHCIDTNHDYFNSNYGIYAYRDGGLKFCIDELTRDHKSRRACFCINNNAVAKNDFEIDKLCTNTIQFLIRDARLIMVVQMRSSNFITLLPYDAFMFSVFYYKVYNELKKKYALLRIGSICMQIASLHFYEDNVNNAFAASSYSGAKDSEILLDFKANYANLINNLNKYLQK